MTVYYCDELTDTSDGYEFMSETNSIICLDISSALKTYRYFAPSFPNCEIEAEYLLPIIIDMIGVKGQFENRLNSFISGLILKNLETNKKSYFSELCELTGKNYIDIPDTWQEDSEVICEQEIMALKNAMFSLGVCILNHIEEVAYRGKYLAYSLFSFENDTIILAPHQIPKSLRPCLATSVELARRDAVVRFEKASG